jgi:hypothetical protein
MHFAFEPSTSQLKVFSAVCSNLVSAWLVAMFVTSDPFALTANMFFVIVSWRLAVKAEQLLEDI